MQLQTKLIVVSFCFGVLIYSCNSTKETDTMYEQNGINVIKQGNVRIVRKNTDYKITIKPNQNLLNNQSNRDKFLLLSFNVAGTFLTTHKLISGDFLQVETDRGEKLSIADYYVDIQEPIEGKSMIAVVNKPLQDYKTVIVKMQNEETLDTLSISFNKEEIQ